MKYKGDELIKAIREKEIKERNRNICNNTS